LTSSFHCNVDAIHINSHEKISHSTLTILHRLWYPAAFGKR
jgi:hypothetical protein